jgi:predicted ATPase
LHPRSQEALVDLFNLAVRDWKKQIIFSTHSWDMLLPYVSDIATGSKRGAGHTPAKPENFKMIVFDRATGKVTIKELDIKGKEFKNIRTPLKELWG